MAKKPNLSTQKVNPAPKIIRAPGKTFDISKAISHARPEEDPAPIYSNHLQVTASASELLLDFFRVAPSPTQPETLNATYLQRVIIPLQKGKAVSQAIAQSMSALEDLLKSNHETENENEPETEEIP